MLASFAVLSRPLKPRRAATGLSVCALALLALLALPGVTWAQEDFTVTPEKPLPGDTVTFDATGLGPVETVSWNFGDGSLPSVEDPATHAFAAGSYDVVMTVLPGGRTVTKTIKVNTPPVALFDFAPAAPVPGQDVLFSASDSSDADGHDLSYTWDFDDGGPAGTGESPKHSFTTPGTYEVVLTVTDELGDADTETVTVVVGDPSAPSVTLTEPAGVPLVGEDVTFTASATASAGNSITAVEWDLDEGEEFDDATGAQASTNFATSGQHVVRVRVTQSNGATDIDQIEFRVNAPPVAGFVWSPTAPLAGAAVQLVSTSVDADGAVSHAWELDGDNDFNDAVTATASVAFAAGTHSVSLRVTDGDGVSRTVTRQITVTAPPPAPTPPADSTTPPPVQPSSPQPTPALRVLSPVVRLAGTLLPRGTRVRILSVRAPRGTLVTARCRGRGCPIRSQTKRSRTGFVRFRKMEGFLRPRARVVVLVQASGAIGRYTRFTIRAGKNPKRTDLCLPPGSSVPQRECGA